jgi:N-acetylglucosaminyl-diphospho-decaprenol L-rhamnosyltransferase
LFRRDCLKQIGLFDERYFAYGDEVDISLRARKAGWGVGLVWGAVVENPSTATPQSMVIYLSSRASLLLASEHAGRIAAAIRSLLMIFNSVRLLLLDRDRWKVRARLRAVQHFYQRKFGRPTEM